MAIEHQAAPVPEFAPLMCGILATVMPVEEFQARIEARIEVRRRWRAAHGN